MLGPKLVQTTNTAIQKIRARMLTAQSRQKSYADVLCKDLEFNVGDIVFLKVAPMNGVLRFENKRKLSLRFVGPFEILERIDPIAYRLALPPSFSAVHDVFHVSMLRKYVADPTHVVDFESLQIIENLSYEEQPVEILAREALGTSTIFFIETKGRNGNPKFFQTLAAVVAPPLPHHHRLVRLITAGSGSQVVLFISSITNRRLPLLSRRGTRANPLHSSRSPEC
ncbi:pol protein [Cucumis melo var. makuwa]|uniref:Pol protein n=1 Tax=Cucumis melo var. makuwa TaxID=1194695 RepID=A0A5D3D7N7_CUCMM|nr:pol protein [Cucumis melo var. makuwa]